VYICNNTGNSWC